MRKAILFFFVMSLNLTTWALSKTFEVDGICYSTCHGDDWQENGEVVVNDLSFLTGSRDYNYYKGTVIIPSQVTYNGQTYTVTGIADQAFVSQRELTTVVLPKTVREIGKRAFKWSTIRSIAFSSNGELTTIGDEAFMSCRQLMSLNLPKSVTSIGLSCFEETPITSIKGCESLVTIGKRAFKSCESLTEVVIPDKVETVGEMAFWSCSALEKVVLGKSVKLLGPDAFLDCNSLRQAILNDGLIEIGYEAFRGCWNLESIIIPNTVTTMGYNTFKYDVGLKEVKLSESLKCIDGWTFQQTSITKIDIPNSVTTILPYAFAECM